MKTKGAKSDGKFWWSSRCGTRKGASKRPIPLIQMWKVVNITNISKVFFNNMIADALDDCYDIPIHSPLESFELCLLHEFCISIELSRILLLSVPAPMTMYTWLLSFHFRPQTYELLSSFDNSHRSQHLINKRPAQSCSRPRSEGLLQSDQLPLKRRSVDFSGLIDSRYFSLSCLVRLVWRVSTLAANQRQQPLSPRLALLLVACHGR
jgi:hypothetical protein